MQVSIYSQDGQVVEKMELPKDIFEAKINEDLIHRFLMMQLSNSRHPIAHTLKRDERAGSTRKLYRQKGTGRARQGDRRSPLHRKAGIVFGPRNERNFKKYMSKTERRGALLAVLSAKANDNAVMGLDKYEGKISTKSFMEMLKKLPVEKNVLIVLPEKNNVIQKSSSNLPHVKSVTVNYLNVKDVLDHGHLLFLKEALEKLPAVFAKK